MVSGKFDDLPNRRGGNPGMAPDVVFTALTTDHSIVWYNAQNLASPLKTMHITGLEEGEELVSIDYLPATGQLYALGLSSRLYFLNESGAATPLGESSFSPQIEGKTLPWILIQQ